jgi:hypothetical protein
MLELWGGLLTGLEALRPSAPHHPSDKATPSYYTKNESFASEISKMWCVLISTNRGVFIVVQGGVTNLVKSLTHQVVVGRPSHMAGRPCGSASTAVPFPFSCRRVHEVTGQTDIKHGRSVRGFSQPATPWAHWSVTFAHCLLVSGTSPGWHLFWCNFKFPCNFLKCTNLAHMFLKSNKH